MNLTAEQMKQAQDNATLLDHAARMLKCPREQVPEKLKAMQQELSELRTTIHGSHQKNI